MQYAFGMQLIFLPKSPKINRRVWKLLNVAVCVQGGGGDGQLSPSKLETASCGEGRCKTISGNSSSQSGCRRTWSEAVMARSHPQDGADAVDGRWEQTPFQLL